MMAPVRMVKNCRRMPPASRTSEAKARMGPVVVGQ